MTSHPTLPPSTLADRLARLWHEGIAAPLTGRGACPLLPALLVDPQLAGRPIFEDLDRLVWTIVGRRLSRFVVGRDRRWQSLSDVADRGAVQAASLLPHLGADQTVLEYGGGIGRIGRSVAPHVRRLVSVDSNPLMKVYGRRFSPGVEFQDLDELPDDETFDGAYSVAVFFHLPLVQQKRALEYVHRRLRPGGWFIVDLMLTREPGGSVNEDGDYREVQPTTLDDFKALYEPMFVSKRIQLFNSGFLLRKRDDGTVSAEALDGRYAVNEASVVADVLDGEVVVVNLDSGAYYILQGSASVIWQMVAAGHAVGDIATSLARDDGAERDGVQSAVTEFVEQLVDEALLLRATSESPSTQRGADVVRPRAEGKSFEAPVMFRYTDMQALIQMDPIREYDENGLASQTPADAASTPPGMTARVEHLDAYFDDALALFDEAVSRAGVGPDRRLVIAACPMHLRFAGDALSTKVLPALAHLPTTGHADEPLIVHLWDLKTTGVVLPPPSWDRLEFHERGNARAYSDERFSLSFERRTDVFSAVDAVRGRAIYWTRDADALPNYTTAAPMQRLLQGWLRTRGRYVLHAASVGREEGGLLLAGRSGSGKSTTALLALDAGFQYVGDDFALVQGEPSPTVHALYSSAKVNADTLDRLPALRAAVTNQSRLDAEKALLFIDTWRPHVLARQFRLRAIVLPHVAGTTASTISPASPLEAYRAIGPDSAFTMLGGDARGLLAMLKRLVYDLPCYHLALGNDRDGVNGALDNILTREAA